MQKRLTGIFLLFLAFVLNACEERAAPAPPVPKEKISILATVFPLATIARGIGGDQVAVEWLAESGQPAPGENVSTETRTRARVVDFVLSDGETWATEGFDDALRSSRIIRLDVLESATSSSAEQGLRWVDPAVAREVAVLLQQRLAMLRPKFEPYFRQRADRFLNELDDVVRQYGPVLNTQPPRQALVLSHDWLRLLTRFGIEPLMPVQSNPSNLTPAQLRELVESARRHRLTAVFVHADTPPAVISDLQNRTDLTVLKLDALGSSAGTERDSYIEILRNNLDQLNQGASRPR